MSLPRNAFSFVFMGTLGLSAAVGASSLGSMQTIDFEPETTLEGLTQDSKNTQIIPSDPLGENNLARLATTIGPQDLANGAFPPPDINDNDAFFLVSSDESFTFLEATLAGSIFEGEGGAVGIYGTSDAGEQFYEQVFGGAGPFTLTASNLSDGRFSGPLTGLGFGASSSSGPSNRGSDDTEVARVISFEPLESELLLDDIVLQSTSEVPVPASMVLLATALLGMGVVRRKSSR